MGRSRNGNKDIIFAGSRKAKVFENAKLRGKTVEDVGGINGVLGRRLRKAGHRTATSLSCQLSGMTKRNYLRYIMKESGSNVRYAMDSYVNLKKHCKKMQDCQCKSKKR
ncbi:hypothetical protein LSAT2_006576 [Lamellibrachia satsuma]|nr:hypothetical protein LSAT2_006576 [Lamellibrachia satsuma]